MNPNFTELLIDLQLMWDRWKEEEQDLRQISQSKASTKRMCMEDVERLIEKYNPSSRLGIHKE